MEFAASRRGRKWKRKRHSRKRLRDQIKTEVELVEVEVRSTKHRKAFPTYNHARETLATGTMQADSFWKNYTVAQEWQKRHNITWWRSRCMALEYENEILRNKLRMLSHYSLYPNTMDNHEEFDDKRAHKKTESNSNVEDLEFVVDEEMLNILEQSERHRREMKKRKSKKSAHKEEIEKIAVLGGAESARVRKEEGNLLYGDSSPKILAMETALQATMDNHKDKVKPQYWPNIPLKP